MFYSQKIVFKFYDQLISVAPEDIVCCKADDDWTIICLSGNRELQINKMISQMMSKLPPTHFSRVHKHWIVNLHYIDEVVWDENFIKMTENISVPLYPMMKLRLENLLLNNPIFCRQLEYMD